MKQSTAVQNAIMSVLKSEGINYELGGETPVSKHTSVFKAQVMGILIEGFNDGEIDFSESSKAKYLGNGKEKELKSYVNGLIDNWVRKFPDFNGGKTYSAKNPGSRSGSGDVQIKEMRKLLKTNTLTAEQKLAVEDAIESRIAEIKPESVVTINAEALPEHLRHLVK